MATPAPPIEYEKMTCQKLKAHCSANGITGYSSRSKAKLIELIRQHDALKQQPATTGQQLGTDDQTEEQFIAQYYDTDDDDYIDDLKTFLPPSPSTKDITTPRLLHHFQQQWKESGDV